MNIRIDRVNTAHGLRWQVCLDRHQVSFHSEQEARQFVATLKARLKAPHSLPDSRLAG